MPPLDRLWRLRHNSEFFFDLIVFGRSWQGLAQFGWGLDWAWLAIRFIRRQWAMGDKAMANAASESYGGTATRKSRRKPLESLKTDRK